MKKIIVLIGFVFMYVVGIAQPITQRGTSSVTVQDARLFAQFNFRPPVFPDTVTANQNIGIDSCGALIFSRDINAYYYRACSPKRWVRFSSGGGSVDTTSLSNRINNKWDINGNSNIVAGTNFLGTTNSVPVEFRFGNVRSGLIDSANKNVGLGYSILRRIAPNGVIVPDGKGSYGTYNVAIGHNALSKDTLGYQNVAIGGAALGTLTTFSKRNVAIGYAALNQAKTPSFDVAIGWGTLARDYYGVGNTAVGSDIANFNAPSAGDTMILNTMVGYGAAYEKVSGKFNVFIGDSTGAKNISGSGNVFIGSKVGKNETGSNKLYIGNSSATVPLIKGDFADSTLIVNGMLAVGSTNKPDSTLDVKGSVRMLGLLPSNNAGDSLMIVKLDGGVGYRSVGSVRIDTTDKFVNNVTKKNDSTITVFKGSTSTDITLPRGVSSTGVTSVSQGYGITNSPNPIISTGTITIDSATLSTKYLRRNDTANLVATKSDVALKINISDSANMLLPYLRKVDTIPMLLPYLRKIDTTNRFVNNVTKKNDSTITVFKGSTSTDIVLPRGGGTSLGDTVYTISPIMSITRNDSNIVYFNEDTANVWRGGGVSISQGYGISNSPNPITSTGTITADTSVSGLSGKYLRIVDTANFNLWVKNGSIITNKPADTIKITSNLKVDTSIQVGIYTKNAAVTSKINTDGLISAKEGFYIADPTTSLPFSGERTGFIKNLFNGSYTKSLRVIAGDYGVADFYNLTTNTTTNSSGLGSLTINPILDNYFQTLGQRNALSFLPSISALTANSITYNQINIRPTYNQGSLGVGVLRGIYYNPNITSLNTSNHIALETTSGKVILKGLTTSSSTSDSIAIFINDTLSKAPYPSVTGFVPYTGATTDLNMGVHNVIANAYFNGFTSMVAAGTTVTLTVDSTPVHLVSGSGGQTYQLPNATTLTNGTIFSFNNNQTSGSISVNNNSGTLVKAVGSGGYMTLELTSNATTAGTWDAHFQTPSNASWSTNTFDYGGSITSAQWNGTTVAYNRGGTGQSSLFTQGGVAFGSTTTALGTTAVGTAGQVLTSAGTGTPTWTTLAANDTTTFYLLSDFTTSSTSATNTNLTFNLGANEVRRIMINGTCSKVGTTGLKLAIGAPTGATIKATQNSSSNAINTSAISVISAINSLGGTINTVTGVEMPFRIEGVITNGANAGAVTLQVATVTSGAVTIYAGTILSVGKVKGL